MEIAAAPADIDAAWMTRALTQAGVLKSGHAVTALSFAGVGHGMMSDSFRFHLRYDSTDASLPTSVVGKFAAADPTSRASAMAFTFYRTEVGFYRDVAPTLAAKVPETLFADLDDATGYFTIIMRDLSPARSIDQIGGCGIDDAVLALRELAKVHGSRWADPTLGQLPWLVARRAAAERMGKIVPELFTSFLERYDDVLEPEYKKMVADLGPIWPAILCDETAIKTLQHGDYRLDNLLFDVGGQTLDGETGTVHILDWGTVANAPGLIDVSYFIGASLSGAERTRHEQELVRLYYDTLSAFRIGNYSWSDCWTDYRRFCFLGMATGVGAPMMVERSERSDKLFLGMVRESGEQIRQLGGFDFWR